VNMSSTIKLRKEMTSAHGTVVLLGAGGPSAAAAAKLTALAAAAPQTSFGWVDTTSHKVSFRPEGRIDTASGPLVVVLQNVKTDKVKGAWVAEAYKVSEDLGCCCCWCSCCSCSCSCCCSCGCC